jgi:hypothetical protein
MVRHPAIRYFDGERAGDFLPQFFRAPPAAQAEKHNPDS